MSRRLATLALSTAISCLGFAAMAPIASAQCFENCPSCTIGGCNCACCDCGYMLPVHRSCWYNWNRNYAHTEYGQPVALVVPPTANLQTNYGWGVASSRLSRIEHQFQRNFPGYGMFGGPFRPTPVWPSDTTQFGVYYVRGPW
jgi:hypothetical protein